jgi:hypothetical protein
MQRATRWRREGEGIQVRWLAASLLVIALGAAGCGGGTKSPGKAAYIAKADRICQTTKVQTAPLVQRLAGAASGSISAAQARRLAAVAGRLHTMGANYVTSLQRLAPPSGDRAEVEQFLAPSRQVVDALGRAATDLRAGNVTGALALLAAGTTTAGQANAAARAYGFKQCVSVLPSGP